MKKEEFDKTKEELEKEIQKNNEQIRINDERKRMARINQVEYKAYMMVIFSMPPYIALLILFSSLTQNGVMASLAKILPMKYFPLIFAGSCIGLGNIGRKILEQKFKIKERLRSFTTARTETEKIVEEIKCTIELEKARNRNEVVQRTLKSLNSSQAILDFLSCQYGIKEKELLQTKEESKKRFEVFSNLLKEEYKRLDTLTTQKILCEKFGIVRDKLEQATNIFVSVMMGAMLTMIYGAAPLILVSNYISFSGILNFLVPLVLGALGASGYMIKKNKDYMIAFNHLNSTLVENSLPAKITNSFKEQKDIDFKIKQKIREISILKMQLQVQKRVMESFKEDSKENAQIMEQVLSKSHNNEPALAGKKVTILEPVQDDLVGFSETDISLEPEEREAILVLKKTKK